MWGINNLKSEQQGPPVQSKAFLPSTYLGLNLNRVNLDRLQVVQNPIVDNPIRRVMVLFVVIVIKGVVQGL